MKFIYLLMSALLGSVLTILIFLSPIRMNMKRAKELKEDKVILNKKETMEAQAKTASFAMNSSRDLPIDSAALMTMSFRNEVIFNIPMAWTFERSDIEKILYDSSINRLKLYAAVKDYYGASVMTLVAVGYNKNMVNDVVANNKGVGTVYEYADPCPPKCKGSNELLWPGCESPTDSCNNCFYRQIISFENIEMADCNFEPDKKADGSE